MLFSKIAAATENSNNMCIYFYQYTIHGGASRNIFKHCFDNKIQDGVHYRKNGLISLIVGDQMSPENLCKPKL